MRAVTRCLSVLALAFAGLASVGVHVAHAETTPTLTVTPSTNLVDGQTVTLDGTGWQPGHGIVVGQQPRSDSVTSGFCNEQMVAADSTGSFHFTWKVSRFILGCGTDCADPATPCQFAAEDIDVPTDNAKANIDFAPVVVPPVIVPGGGSVIEGSGGTKTLRIPVTTSELSVKPITVQWNTVFVGTYPLEANPTSDYAPASGTLNLGEGFPTSITITVNGDTVVEPDEWIIVRFHDPVNATLGGFGGLGFGVIIDDDRSTVVPGGASVLEGNSGTTQLDVPVTLSRPSTVPVTVQWNTVFLNAGSAIEADPTNDYTPASGTVTFAPGETAKTVPISINGDTRVEPNEWIVISFHDAFLANIGGYGGLGFGVITNDDG